MTPNLFTQAKNLPSFSSSVFTQGDKLGLWDNLKTGAPGSTSYVATPNQSAFQRTLQEMKEAGIDTSTIPASELLNYQMVNKLIGADPKQQWELTREQLNDQEARDLRIAKERQKLGEQSMGKAVLYQSLANIGPTIAQAMNPGYLMEGADRIARTANEAFRSVPAMNVQYPGYSQPQYKYF